MRVLDQLGADLRHSVRVLRNAPVFTAIAILSLALGIGANTAIFGIVNAVILKALPVTEPERLVQVELDSPGRSWTAMTNPIWETIRDQHGDLFDGAFAFNNTSFDENAAGESRAIEGLWVSGGFFDVLGVRPWIGRMLTPADDVRGGGGADGPAAVISYAFWQTRYGAAPDVLGRQLSLNGQPFTIVGVTPPGFHGVEIGRSFSVVVPLGCEPLIRRTDSLLDEHGAWWLRILGRLRRDRTLDATMAGLRAAQPSIREAAATPGVAPAKRRTFLNLPFLVTPASTGTSFLRQQYRVALYTLLAVVAVVLLIACTNLANLLLARATVRQKEFAVRLALGASRPRLIRQLLIESLLIASAGAALGLILARWASRFLVYQLSGATQSAFPVTLDLTMDWRVLGFTIAATIATALLFGLAPALRSTDLSAGTLMKGSARSIVAGWTRFNLEKLLIAAQIALSLVLIFGASLFVRSFTTLATLDPGFKREHLLVAAVDIRRLDFPQARRAQLYDQLRETMRQQAGVQALAATSIEIMRNGGWNGDIKIDGYTPTSDHDMVVMLNTVSPGYFATMGTAIRAGRDFTDRDTAQAPRVAVVTEAFARKYFAGKNAVGQRYTRDGKVTEIVGVIQDRKYMNLRDTMPPTAFEPLAQAPGAGNSLSFVVRATGDPLSLIPSLSQAIGSVNKNVSFTFTTLDATINATLTQERMLAMLAGFFGMLALLVAGVGLYGVMWLAMTRRRGEIGIRMALGAQPDTVICMVLHEVGVVAAIGMAAGVAIAMAGGGLVSNLLYGLTSTDTSTALVAIVLLGSVAALASYLPARRAARLDPMTALRDE